MGNLTEQDIIAHLDKMKNSFERGVSSMSWMGIEVSWQRKPKRDGGNILRNKTWGCWEYHDMLTGKALLHEEAVKEILKPFGERKVKVDLTNIKYCGVCQTIAVGEDEQFLWGSLSYVFAVQKYSDGSKYPRHKHIDVCRDCCRKILQNSLTLGS